MAFTSPLWLAALLPWAAVTIYLLLGRRARVEVPFVDLWRGPIHAPRLKHAMHRIPAWITLLLTACAIAIIAASGPYHPVMPPLEIAPSVSAGIESIAVRENQCMVRIRNGSPPLATELLIETDTDRSSQQIELPPAGESRNYFVDVPGGATRVRATLSQIDPKQPGRSVEVIRRRSWPAVHALAPLPADVRRIVDIYTARRPASADSQQIGVATSDPSQLAGQPGVIVANASDPMNAPITATSHPVTANVRWEELGDAKRAVSPPKDFVPVVSTADGALVAVRDKPVRQVWVGFESPNFARSPAFVIFWTDVLDWVGQGGDEFVPVAGTTFANASNRAGAFPTASGVDLSPWLACVAVGLSVWAMAAVPKANPRVFP